MYKGLPCLWLHVTLLDKNIMVISSILQFKAGYNDQVIEFIKLFRLVDETAVMRSNNVSMLAEYLSAHF